VSGDGPYLLPCTLVTVLCVTCSTASSTTSVAMLRGVEPKAVEKQQSQYHMFDTQLCNSFTNCLYLHVILKQTAFFFF
jgi:hypothetical protein